MTRAEFKELTAGRIVFLDGATGTELAKRGMPGGVCPEKWILEHPEAICGVEQAYIAAGSDIVYIPSFGGNRVKLKEFGLENKVYEINRALAEKAVKNMPGKLPFGDLAPTGLFIEPCGELPFEEAVAIFREQAQALLDGGAAGFVIETMLDLQEARAALLAVREICDLPVIVTMTFDESGRTLTGCGAVSSLLALQALGADAFGCNCSTGPENMLPLIAEMKRYAHIPLIAKPNAGMPKLCGMKTVFDLGAADFAAQCRQLAEAGANIMGGCCGTTPEHIAALTAEVAKLSPLPPSPEIRCAVSSAAGSCALGAAMPFAVIGERINPTGKKTLQAQLRENNCELVRQYALDQLSAGAKILDVNCGMPGIDECAMLRRLTSEVCRTAAEAVLCIDTTRPDAAEAALRLYPGRALFNSISAETNRLENILPLVAKYGAVPVVLPLTDDGIPDTLEGRLAALETIFAACEKHGIPREICCVDALVMTVSANPEAAKLTLDLIEHVTKVMGLNTVCGLSNVSFGLPRRELANAAFLGLAMGRGLNMAIANPSAPLLMDMVNSADMLTGRDVRMVKYIATYGNSVAAAGGATVGGAAAKSPAELAGDAVLHGDAAALTKHLQAALTSGVGAQELIDAHLVPAISKVGDLFEAKKFFLPQLVQSADAMRKAMDILLPLLKNSSAGQEALPKIILATVKGDIHDIGKNIVSLMLRNYGFAVIDLGKDVAPEVILDAAVRHNARLVGLSALMTTTMVEMPKVIDMAHERGLKELKFIVGGAVLTADYADKIGASYAKDALDTVKIARSLLD